MRYIALILLLITILTIQCQNDCKIDMVFKKRFFNNIEILRIPYTKTTKSVEVIKFRNAMYFLIAVTRINPAGFDIEHGVYFSHKAYKDDKKKWIIWYKNNKCEITNSKADSLLKDYMIVNQRAITQKKKLDVESRGFSF